MTRHHSTISNEIDFKLRLIAHFKKVYKKCVDDKSTRAMMVDQTVRTYNEVREMIDPGGNGVDKVLSKVANKLADKYDVKSWIRDAIRPDEKFPEPAREMMDV